MLLMLHCNHSKLASVLTCTPTCDYVGTLLAWLQVAPFRKLRKEKSEQGKGRLTDFIKYDIRQMHTAFTGTIPFSREEEDVLVSFASLTTH